MSFEITGTLHKKYDVEQISETFTKRMFVLKVEEEGNNNQKYQNFILFQLSGKNVELIDKIQQGAILKVRFSVKGSEWTSKDGITKVFNNLNAFHIEEAKNNNLAEPKGNLPKKTTEAESDEKSDLETESTKTEVIPPMPTLAEGDIDNQLPF